MSKKSKSKGPAKATKENTVVVDAPNEKTAAQPAKEEVFDALASVKNAVKTKTRTKLNTLIDKTTAEAKSVLDELVAAGEIGSFQILPQGKAFSAEFESSRVQVLTVSDIVKEVEVG